MFEDGLRIRVIVLVKYHQVTSAELPVINSLVHV